MSRPRPAVDPAVCTFVSLLGLSEVDLGDRLEVGVPQPDAAVPASGGEALLARVHAEDTSLHTRTHTHTHLTLLR